MYYTRGYYALKITVLSRKSKLVTKFFYRNLTLNNFLSVSGLIKILSYLIPTIDEAHIMKSMKLGIKSYKGREPSVISFTNLNQNM